MINLSWLRHVTFAAWILLSLYCMGFFVAIGVCTSFVDKKLKLPLTITAPFIWVSLEYLRSFLLTGFPWLFIGHSQHQYLTLIQISDITGVYGISFMLVLINAGMAELILLLNSDYKHNTFSFYSIINAIFPVILLTVVTLYGFSCIKRYTTETGANVSVIQGNILQNVKNIPDKIQKVENLQKYVTLSMENIGKNVDLVVWPETMIPGILNLDPNLSGRSIDRISQESIKNLAYVLNSHLLIGGTSIETENNNQFFYNSAFFYNKNGEFVDRYDKIHLVPFGEYTPLKKYFPFLAKLVPYEVSLSHGVNMEIFNLPLEGSKNIKFGVLICYEDTIPSLVREFRNKGADFFINITNDGWFKNSAELDQHLAIMVFRAVENRSGIVRAANTGISAFVNPNGKVYNKLQDKSGKYREIEGVLTDRIRLTKETTVTWYTKHGDCFAFFCLLFSGIVFGISLLKHFSIYRYNVPDGTR